MKKIFKITIVNLLILILMLLTSEIICLIKVSESDYKNEIRPYIDTQNFKIPNLKFNDYFNKIKENYIERDYNSYFSINEFRKPSEGILYNSTNDNIIIAGCSFAYGKELKYNNTFSAILSDYLKTYKVYNIGLIGASPRETLYILKNYNKYSKYDILPANKNANTKYFIYVYVGDQIRRCAADIYRTSPKFKKYKDQQNLNKLKLNKSNNFILKTFTYKYVSNKFTPRNLSCFNNLFILYIKEIKREVVKIFPNAEFVFFVYTPDNYKDSNTTILEKENIKVIKLNDICNIKISRDKEFMSYDGAHPNKKAWEIIVPALVKKLER